VSGDWWFLWQSEKPWLPWCCGPLNLDRCGDKPVATSCYGGWSCSSEERLVAVVPGYGLGEAGVMRDVVDTWLLTLSLQETWLLWELDNGDTVVNHLWKLDGRMFQTNVFYHYSIKSNMGCPVLHLQFSVFYIMQCHWMDQRTLKCNMSIILSLYAHWKMNCLN